MKVKTNIMYSFTANGETYNVGDKVKVKTEFLDRCGEITKINFVGFEISMQDERIINIKYEQLLSIQKV